MNCTWKLSGKIAATSFVVITSCLVSFAPDVSAGTSTTEPTPPLSAPVPALSLAGEGPTLIGEQITVDEAIDRVGTAAIAAANTDVTRAEVVKLAKDPDARVDASGRILFVDEGLVPEPGSIATYANPTSEVIAAAATPLTSSDTFNLESRPGSQHTIYLDFNGATVTGTAWNNTDSTINVQAFDRDGDPSSFGDFELAFIQEVWAQVAEDYAPFDVNVTTKDPGADAYTRSSESDTTYGSHAVITNDIVSTVCDGCAGVAYFGAMLSTNNASLSPAWVFTHRMYEGDDLWTGSLYAAVTISHEVGHNFGLSHDGKSSEYYGGQGIWAPIMGGGQTRPIFQWSNGDYASPTNTEDDLSIIAASTPLIADDHGDSLAGATATSLASPITGLIGTRDDEDFFKISGASGTLHLRVSPAVYAPNLDIQLELLDSSGSLLTSSNPTATEPATRTDYNNKALKGMGAWIDYTVSPSQDVYVVVSGVGNGVATDTGYSDYGSLGQYTLSTTNPELTVKVAGPGTVTSSSGGISCTTTCSATFDPDADHNPATDTIVTLTATPSSGAVIAYWVGPCEYHYTDYIPEITTCKAYMDQAREVTAVFRYNRSVSVSVVGSGTVTTGSKGWTINCGDLGSICSSTGWRPYVVLTAVPGAGFVFKQWTGGCTGTATTCTVLMTDAKSVTAEFADHMDLSVEVVGNGLVTSDIAGISCSGPTDSPCTHTYSVNDTVVLTATPGESAAFSGWSGDCSGTSTCSVSMSSARSVTATFVTGGVLSVTIVGATGSVVSDQGGVNCSGPTVTPCTYAFDLSSSVTLYAYGDLNGYSSFSAWSGAGCSGTDPCTIVMSEARSVTATFVPNHRVMVTLEGSGTGSVVFTAQDYTCSSDPYSWCNPYIAEGTSVTLRADDVPGFFTGWSGDCSGSSRTCTFNLNEDKNVTATFDLGDQFSIFSSGNGTFTTTKGWVNCSSGSCNGAKPSGSTAVLTAVPDPGNYFAGWSNLCSGYGTCTVKNNLSSPPMAQFFSASPIDAGDNFTCRTANGGVKCWGANASGQVGNNTTSSAVKRPESVRNLSDVAQVSTGGSHACALLDAGTVKCWGENANGQLGNNSTTDAKTPVVVSGLADVQYIEAGTDHTCALLESGAVKCWGKGGNGRLGNNLTTDAKTPVSVSGIGGSNPKALAISSGGSHTCAFLNNGTVKCWGANASGQLGNNSTADAKTPVAVSGLTAVIGVSAGGSHTCALLSAYTVKCWGANASGQLGNNSTTISKVPVVASGISSVLSLSTGSSHTCVVVPSGWFDHAVKCWGAGGNGRLGNNATTNAKVGVVSSGTVGATAVSAGGAHSCSAIVSGQSTTYKCWGAGTSGQLGNNALVDKLIAVGVA